MPAGALIATFSGGAAREYQFGFAIGKRVKMSAAHSWRGRHFFAHSPCLPPSRREEGTEKEKIFHGEEGMNKKKSTCRKGEESAKNGQRGSFSCGDKERYKGDRKGKVFSWERKEEEEEKTSPSALFVSPLTLVLRGWLRKQPGDEKNGGLPLAFALRGFAGKTRRKQKPQ